MRILLFVICFFTGASIFAQTFNYTAGGVIPDNNVETCFPIKVTGVGVISATYGLARVCINISHPSVGNLEVRLKAPDGTIVPLSLRNGGFGDNFANTCFTGVATNSIASGAAPFTGTYLPQGFLGSVNNNQNADGFWNLCVKDAFRPDSGRIVSWNLLFSNNPAPQPPLPPANDDPCSAFTLPVGSSCSYTTYSNYGASGSVGIPNPTCAAFSGGDVWFKVVVPANGIVQIDTKEGTVLDAAMAVYTGTSCGALTQIRCDDNTSANGFMPFISASGLTPGTTIWIRVWVKGNDNNGTFGICVTTPPPMPSCSGNPPAGNRCNQAPVVCNNEGFCGNTSSMYTVDVWPELTAAFNCGAIQNNSFLKFTAAAPDVSFYVWVTNSTRNGGIQMMIYSGGCLSGAVTRHACYQRIPPSAGVPTLVSATGLTPGNTYYIMVDGYSGDVCDYVIAPNTGTSALSVLPTSGSSNQICKGKSVQLVATGGNNVYSWSPAAGLNVTTGDTVIASPDTTTTYTILSNAPAGCSGASSTTITVTVNPTPALGPDKTISICTGATIDLNTLFSLTASTPQWTLNGVNVTNPAAVSQPGNYRLIALNSSGCSDTAFVMLSLINKLQLGNDKTITICRGGQADLTTLFVTTGLSVNWTFNTTPVNNPASVSAPGIYQIVVSDGTSCPDTALVTVAIASSVPDPPTVVSLCSTTLPYNWHGKNYTSSGLYYDTLTSIFGCDSIVTLQLYVKNPSSSTTVATVCPSSLPYIWNGSNYNSTGTYYDTILNAAGCDSIMTLQLTIKSNSSSTVSVGICPSQIPYLWNGVLYDSSGTYTINTINAQGCDSTATLQLTIYPIPAAPFASSNSPVCSGTSIQLNAVGDPGAVFAWSGPAAFSSSAQNPAINDVSVINGGIYSVKAFVNNCPSALSTTRVDILSAPVVNLGPDRVAYEGDTVYLSPQISGSPVKFLWSPTSYFLAADTLQNAMILAINSTQYSLVVTGSNACISKPDYITVKVLPRIKPYNIPNSFSPNGDGINDKWFIRDLLAFPSAKVEVFNRYGQPVYSGVGNTAGWDGTNNGKPVPVGVYYYVITVKPNGPVLSGWVAIIK